MLRTTGSVTKILRAGGLLGALFAMAACSSAPPPQAGATAPPAETQAEAAPAAPVVDPNAPLVVALLTPTMAEGKRVRAAAQDLTAAAQMARADSGVSNVNLKIYDTKGDPAVAAEVAGQAIAEGAAVIIGPLLGASAAAVSPVAEQAGINVLAFSNDRSAAGAPVWILGQQPGEELRGVMSFAASQGVGSVAVVYPTNRYGELMAAEAGDAGAQAGVAVGPYIPYERSFQGIERATQQGAAAIRASGADGVLIADAGDGLRSAASFLSYYDVSPRRFRYMGTSRWADPGNTKETALQGGWYAAGDEAAAAEFEARFRQTMGRAPSRLAGVGYQAMAIVAELVRDARASGDQTPFSAENLTRSRGFDSVAGQIVLTPDGRNRRPLAIYEVQPEGLTVVAPATGAGPGA